MVVSCKRFSKGGVAIFTYPGCHFACFHGLDLYLDGNMEAPVIFRLV